MTLLIKGKAPVSWPVAANFVKRINNQFDEKIAWAYWDLCQLYDYDALGVFCQAIKESNYFRSFRATKNHNYAGVGATNDGAIGNVTSSEVFGVMQHLAHLQAYTYRPGISLVAKAIDSRYDLVKGGTAVYWTDLNDRWAVNYDTNGNIVPNRYGQEIESLYNRVLSFAGAQP